MPNVFVSKENFVVDDDWLNQRPITDQTNEVFGVGVTPPANLAALKADATYGDGDYAGAAFTQGQFVRLGDNSQAYYASNVWSAGTTP